MFLNLSIIEKLRGSFLKTVKQTKNKH